MKDNEIIKFEDHGIRKEWFNDRWYFSVVDVVSILIDKDYQTSRKYWNKLSERLKKEGSGQTVTKCHRLKMRAADGRMRDTDAADVETLFRIIQSIPSPKAEPMKLWLARIGYERIQEYEDPSTAVDRARDIYKKQGRSKEWIRLRLSGQETRNNLTDYWSEHDVKKGQEYAILTNIIHEEWSDLNVNEHKALKGLKTQNLRDHMSEAELIFTALAELSTRQVAERDNATGMPQNKVAAKEGGSIAKRARLDFEKRTGKKVVTSSNFIPEQSSKRNEIEEK